MIFVTVGTHEQPFNRLVQTVDRLKSSGVITDEVFIQTGYSTYKPKSCKYKDFISAKQMDDYVENANIVITHGGPSSFILTLQHGKVPIVVPRLSKFNEHVNDHQLYFCKELVLRHFPIDLVENIDLLSQKIDEVQLGANKIAFDLNNAKFIEKFNKLINDL